MIFLKSVSKLKRQQHKFKKKQLTEDKVLRDLAQEKILKRLRLVG